MNKKSLLNKHRRHAMIVQLIENNDNDQVLSTQDLAAYFGVSAMTIRRDLDELAATGLIKRRHGGALPAEHGHDPPLQQPKENIGVFISSREGKYSDPFFSAVLDGLDQRLQESGYHPAFIHSHAEIQTVMQTKELLQNQPVAAMLLVGVRHTKKNIEYISRHVPIVSTVCESLGPEHDAILIGGDMGIRQIVDHLVGLGRRRLGFITGFSDLREKGFMDGLQANNLPDDPALRVTLPYGYEGWIPPMGEQGAHMLMGLPNPPDAIVCASDRLAIGVLQWLHQHGIRVPDDVAVTGFDNIPSSEFTIPPLTTVQVHKEYMGRLCAERAIRRLENPQEVPLQIFTPTYAIIRQSCGAPRIP